MANLQEYRTMTHQIKTSRTLKVLDTLCSRIEDLFIFLSATAVIVAMLVTFLDVVMRYGFKSPVSWAFDFITMYLLTGGYFLAFSYALRTGNHLKVDYFKDKLPEKLQRLSVLTAGLLAIGIFLFVSYAYTLRAYDSWAHNEVIYGAVNWLVWPSDLIIAVSAFVFALRLIVNVLDKPTLKGSEL